MSHLRIATFLPIVLLAGGCQLAPEYEQPAAALPGSLGLPAAEEGQRVELNRWWEVFEDPELNRWIERSLEANYDIAISASRVEQARARLGFTRADRWPELSAQAGAGRSESSTFSAAPGADGPRSTYQVAGMLNFELDLWGRLANAERSAREQLLATTYAYETVRTTLIADTATLYFNLKAAREQLRIARETVEGRMAALDLQDIRWQGGFITELERQQAAVELATARVTIPNLQEQIATMESALLILAGAEPEAFWDPAATESVAGNLPVPPEISLDVVPASVLERRPDILAAEAEARAATFDIGVLRAQRWPTLSLGAMLGTAAGSVGDLFSDGSDMWSITGDLVGPVYDFGRRRLRVEEGEAIREQVLLRYQAVVRQAFREVRDAVALMNYAEDRSDARAAQAAALDRTVELAEVRYEEGYTSFLDLLDAQRLQFDAQLAWIQAERDRLVATISLYRSLGGGWELNGETTVEGEVVGED